MVERAADAGFARQYNATGKTNLAPPTTIGNDRDTTNLKTRAILAHLKCPLKIVVEQFAGISLSLLPYFEHQIQWEGNGAFFWCKTKASNRFSTDSFLECHSL